MMSKKPAVDAQVVPLLRNIRELAELRFHIENKILVALSSTKPMRRKHLLYSAQSPLEETIVDTALEKLVKRQVIKRIRHGVYIDARVRNPKAKAVPPMNIIPNSLTAKKIMQLLRRPRRPPDLLNEMQVSRQRIHKLLEQLLISGIVARRKVRGRKQYEYFVSKTSKLHQSA